jgi:hypothetical protein
VVAGIEAEFALPSLLIGPVALEAAVQEEIKGK